MGDEKKDLNREETLIRISESFSALRELILLALESEKQEESDSDCVEDKKPPPLRTTTRSRCRVVKPFADVDKRRPIYNEASGRYYDYLGREVSEDYVNELNEKREAQRRNLRQAVLRGGGATMIPYGGLQNELVGKTKRPFIIPLPPDAKVKKSMGKFSTPENPFGRVQSQKKAPKPTSRARSKPTKSTTDKGVGIKCKICGYKAKDIGDLSSHRSKKHPKAVSESAKRGRETKKDASADKIKMALDFARDQRKK